MKRHHLLGLAFLAVLSGCADQPRPHLEKARAVAKWLQDVSVVGEDGIDWPVVPDEALRSSPDLYSGTPGVVLFFLEMAQATGEPEYLQTASRGADYLMTQMGVQQPGLYTGLAGIAFTLEMMHRATGEGRYREAALQCLERIHGRARQEGAGVRWNTSTDIIGGSAGIGLFLLWAADNMEHAASRDLAVRAGRRLAQLGEKVGEGSKWAMNADNPRLYPNLSHGTAGVCYFLARLYEETMDPEFRGAAEEGGRYLQAVANPAGLVFHDEPGGEDLFYLGWCHGPPGTSRLFELLEKFNPEARWEAMVHRSAGSMLASGIPQTPQPGFWNNVGQCCGSAGVGEFFLRRYQSDGDEAYLEFCERLTADIYDRADSSEDALKWVQAEHRVQPELLQAQTGLMQGASGIGLWLLHLDGHYQGRQPFVVLPDA